MAPETIGQKNVLGLCTMQIYDCSGVVGSWWRNKHREKVRERSSVVHPSMSEERERQAE